MIREFTGLEGEAGFVLTHVMVASKSNKLISLINSALKHIQAQSDRIEVNKVMDELAEHIYVIATEMKEMYHRSEVDHFHKFRTFLSGCKNNSIFPNGVIFEGV